MISSYNLWLPASTSSTLWNTFPANVHNPLHVKLIDLWFLLMVFCNEKKGFLYDTRFAKISSRGHLAISTMQFARPYCGHVWDAASQEELQCSSDIHANYLYAVIRIHVYFAYTHMPICVHMCAYIGVFFLLCMLPSFFIWSMWTLSSSVL